MGTTYLNATIKQTSFAKLDTVLSSTYQDVEYKRTGNSEIYIKGPDFDIYIKDDDIKREGYALHHYNMLVNGTYEGPWENSLAKIQGLIVIFEEGNFIYSLEAYDEDDGDLEFEQDHADW